MDDLQRLFEHALVLMDCHMPVMDGVEACRRAGINECLTKPVSFKTLQRALHQVARYQAMLDQDV